MAMTLVAYCLTSVAWVAWGYSLAFGDNANLFIGNVVHINAEVSGLGSFLLTTSIPNIH